VRVAIIGAGAAGSFLAYLLAQRQIPTVIFERESSREKPCGGGCTPKVFRSYPLFSQMFLAKNQIYRIYGESSAARIRLDLKEPIWIYSRRDLDGFLLDQAVQSGSRLVHSPAIDFQCDGQGWTVHTKDGNRVQADILVGADGASSRVRKRMGVHFGAQDLSVALGYYVPGSFHPDSIYIRFLDPQLQGYIWSFPRVDHLSVGIVSLYRDLPAPQLRGHLENFLADRYGILHCSDFPGYAAPVPTLSEQTWKNLRVNGSNWALIGDAAGFVDPVTAEGIYYALRSADLLAAAIQAGNLDLFHQSWREDFGNDLARGSALRESFYRRRLARKPFLTRTLQVAGRSPTIQRVFIDLMSGSLHYRALKLRLLRQVPRVTFDLCRAALSRNQEARSV
jgi:geranylgeranyl reductase family protein